MIEMKLIAKTDEYKQALILLIPQLWEFASKIPNLLDRFEDEMGLLLRVEDTHDVTKALGVFRDFEF